jgi:transcriptional regulator GlxA family with amidase domain
MDDLATSLPDRFPTAISSLIEAAVATFDSDRETSRRYLQRVSALLRARHRPKADPECVAASNVPADLATWRVNRVLDYVERHLSRTITIDELCSVISVSRGQLRRAFKVSVGLSPSRFIARTRIERACAILRTSREPLCQVALACGLYDQSHFCRVFRRNTGVSPSAWRRANCVDPSQHSVRV